MKDVVFYTTNGDAVSKYDCDDIERIFQISTPLGSFFVEAVAYGSSRPIELVIGSLQPCCTPEDIYWKDGYPGCKHCRQYIDTKPQAAFPISGYGEWLEHERFVEVFLPAVKSEPLESILVLNDLYKCITEFFYPKVKVY